MKMLFVLSVLKKLLVPMEVRPAMATKGMLAKGAVTGNVKPRLLASILNCAMAA